MSGMEDSNDRLDTVLSRISVACADSGRPPGSVRLVAVSKKKPAGMVRDLARAGQRDFGENYCSEGLEKMEELADEDICWHFVGAVQSRKAATIAGAFDWVHSVDRAKVAERLDRGREGAGPPLNVCIQVNVDREEGKAGATAEEAPGLAKLVAGLGNLRLRGLMALPRPTPDLSGQRAAFRALRGLRDEIAGQGIPLDDLSMGMTDDLEVAIAEGATIVRVGTALFGPRDP